VVRTRMFVTDRAHIGAVTTVHGEVFGEIRPAATIVVVAGLIDPSLLVEIEVDARRASP
jgi:enamine deaminase RidA (YjgF/YER057c/UK114 family)